MPWPHTHYAQTNFYYLGHWLTNGIVLKTQQKQLHKQSAAVAVINDLIMVGIQDCSNLEIYIITRISGRYAPSILVVVHMQRLPSHMVHTVTYAKTDQAQCACSLTAYVFPLNSVSPFATVYF